MTFLKIKLSHFDFKTNNTFQTEYKLISITFTDLVTQLLTQKQIEDSNGNDK